MQTSQNHIHILLIDDHKMMRSGLSSLLEKETDFSIIGAAESEEQAVKILEKQDADVALINLSRQDSATSNCVRVVRDFFPEMAILVITDRNQKDYFRTMIRAGANGIVFSQSDPDSLRLGIRAIAKQGMYFSSEIRPAVEAFFVKSNGAISSFIQSDIDLTPREAEVLQLIIQEKTTAEIAIELSISTRTVDTHRRNLILKTGVRNTAGLVRFSMENNLY